MADSGIDLHGKLKAGYSNQTLLGIWLKPAKTNCLPKTLNE